MSGDAHEWMSAHIALGGRISPERVAELYRQDRADSVLKFAKQIGVTMEPWQEWIIRSYFGSPDKPLTCENPVVTHDRGASL